MGLGGGFLMTIWDARTKTANYLDARETAPSDAHKDMFKGNPDLATYGKVLDLFIVIIVRYTHAF